MLTRTVVLLSTDARTPGSSCSWTRYARPSEVIQVSIADCRGGSILVTVTTTP